MATVSNNYNQSLEHFGNVGKTVLTAKWTWTLDHTGATATGDYLSLIESISGACRANGYTAKITNIRLCNTFTSTPQSKACAIYFFSKSSIPATTPVVNAAATLINTDAQYILGRADFAAADWKVLDDVSVQTKEVSIPIVNEDSTTGTSIYAVAVHTDSSATFGNGEKLEVTIWIEMY